MNIILEICTDATGLQFFVIYYSTMDDGYKPGYEIAEQTGEQYEENDFAFNLSNGLEKEAITENMLFRNILTRETTNEQDYPSIYLGTKPAEEEVFKTSLANTIKLIKKLGYPYFLSNNGITSEKRNRREDEDYIKEADELYFAQEGKIF